MLSGVMKALDEIFILMETVDDKKRKSDEQILESIRRHFPASSIKTTLDIAKKRQCFNEGRLEWARLGTAESRGYKRSKPRHDVTQDNETAILSEDMLNEIVDARIDLKEDQIVHKIRQDLLGPITVAVRSCFEDIDVEGILQEKLKSRPIISVKFDDSTIVVDALQQHAKFSEVLMKLRAGLPVLLVGPTGSGKTHLCKQVAEALNLPFTFNSMSEGISEAVLLGRTLPDENGAWKYKPSPFVESYSSGGVHLLDEFDASDPNLLVQVNAALANKLLSIPMRDELEPIVQHKNSFIIAAANTYGSGADASYVGRNQLDAATMNRFTMGKVFVDYDKFLEARIAQTIAGPQADELVSWAWSIRECITDNRLRRFMSTRNIEDASKFIAAGASMEDVKDTYFQDWTKEELSHV